MPITENGKTIRIGGVEWGFGECPTAPGAGDFESTSRSVRKAVSLDCDTLIVSIGSTPDGKLKLADTSLQKRYLTELYHVREEGKPLVIAEVCLDRFHTRSFTSPDKDDQRKAVKDVLTTLRIAEDMGVDTARLPFFGNRIITPENESDVIGRLQEVAGEAEERGIILTLEHMLDPEANNRILGKVGSKNVLNDPDAGNIRKAKRKGTPADEIRAVGQIIPEIDGSGAHKLDMKDNTWEGKIDPRYLTNDTENDARFDVDDTIRAAVEVGITDIFLESLSPRRPAPRESWTATDQNLVEADYRYNIHLLRGSVQRVLAEFK